MTNRRMYVAVVFASSVSACSGVNDADSNTVSWNTLHGNAPLVVAHRGASAHLPGHTLEAYEPRRNQNA